MDGMDRIDWRECRRRMDGMDLMDGICRINTCRIGRIDRTEMINKMDRINGIDEVDGIDEMDVMERTEGRGKMDGME